MKLSMLKAVVSTRQAYASSAVSNPTTAHLSAKSMISLAGVVHAYVGQNVLKCYIRLNFRNFFLAGFVFLTLLLVDATDFRNQSPKCSQL
jgi:hypothetical protein